MQKVACLSITTFKFLKIKDKRKQINMKKKDKRPQIRKTRKQAEGQSDGQTML